MTIVFAALENAQLKTHIETVDKESINLRLPTKVRTALFMPAWLLPIDRCRHAYLVTVENSPRARSRSRGGATRK